jgi:hypothetical protein
MSTPPSTLDVDRFCAERTIRCSDAGRGRRRGRTSTYRFAAVEVNGVVKVDVHVNAHGGSL